MSEPRELTIKRLTMRSMRRGIKEMDLILQAFAERRLDAMSSEELALYDQLLSESDQDLYQWVTGQAAPPAPLSNLIQDISDTFQQ